MSYFYTVHLCIVNSKKLFLQSYDKEIKISSVSDCTSRADDLLLELRNRGFYAQRASVKRYFTLNSHYIHERQKKNIHVDFFNFNLNVIEVLWKILLRC